MKTLPATIDAPARFAAMPCSTWTFRYTLSNLGSENLASGKKRCENEGCEAVAQHIAEGTTSIFFACDQCVRLIPDVNILKSNNNSATTH